MARTKQFIVRKYVMAKSAQEAIKFESKYKVDEVFVDDKWLEQNPIQTKHVGYGKKKN